MVAGSPRKHFHPASKLHSILWPISLLGKNRSGTAAKLPSEKAPTEVEKPKEREAEQAAADFPLTFLQSSLQNTFMDARPRGRVREIQSSRPGCAKDAAAIWLHACGPVLGSCRFALDSPALTLAIIVCYSLLPSGLTSCCSAAMCLYQRSA